MDYIEWNYLRAKEQAGRLEDQAERLSRLAGGEMNGTLREVACEWQGESSGRYIRKGEQLVAEIESMAKALCRTASVIRSQAERTYRAELHARELARKREY